MKMELIDKAALISEIERRLEAIANTSSENNREFAVIQGAQQYELINLILFINTLETKEVNLDKELKTLDDTLFDLDGVAIQGATKYITVDDVKEIAKHFYELGLKAKGE